MKVGWIKGGKARKDQPWMIAARAFEAAGIRIKSIKEVKIEVRKMDSAEHSRKHWILLDAGEEEDEEFWGLLELMKEEYDKEEESRRRRDQGSWRKTKTDRWPSPVCISRANSSSPLCTFEANRANTASIRASRRRAAMARSRANRASWKLN